MYELEIKGTKLQLTKEEAQTLLGLLQTQLMSAVDPYAPWKLAPPSTTPQRPFEAIWQVFPEHLPQYQISPLNMYKTTGVESTPKTNGINFSAIAAQP